MITTTNTISETKEHQEPKEMLELRNIITKIRGEGTEEIISDLKDQT